MADSIAEPVIAADEVIMCIYVTSVFVVITIMVEEVAGLDTALAPTGLSAEILFSATCP
jgi:hypothetical protein